MESTNKAIIVINVPDNFDFNCKANVEINIGKKKIFRSRRIIRPLPQKKGKYGELHQYDTDIHYEIGWNKCLEELEKC